MRLGTCIVKSWSQTQTLVTSAHIRQKASASAMPHNFRPLSSVARIGSRNESARDRSTIDPVPITDQVAWDLIPGECFPLVAARSFCRRVRCHIDKDKLSPSQLDNDQYVELDKADGRNHEQMRTLRCSTISCCL